MAKTGQSQYGMCEKCGADNSLSRQGKVYCSDKCWLNGQPQQSRPQFVNRGGNLEVKKEPEWEKIRAEKTDNINLLNARTNAVNIAIALYNKGDITSEVVISKVKELTEQLKQIGENGTGN